jgi:hypothetical protein
VYHQLSTPEATDFVTTRVVQIFGVQFSHPKPFTIIYNASKYAPRIEGNKTILIGESCFQGDSAFI